MAKTIKTGLIITGDAKGGVSALKLTDEQLKGLNSTQKKAAQHNKDAGVSFGDATKKAAAYGAAAALAAGAGVALLVKQQLASIDSTAKISDKLGIATENLTAMRIQAELSGVATETLDMGLQRMVRRVGEAAQGTGEAKDALKELNINAVELAKLSPDKQFAAIGDAMGGVGNQADRVRLAFKLFDSGGVALLNTLKGGSAAALEAAAFTEQWGLAINRVDSAKVEMANDAIGKVAMASEGLWKQLAVGVAPALIAVSEGILGVSRELGSAEEQADSMVDGFVSAVGFVGDSVRVLELIWSGYTRLLSEGISRLFTEIASLDKSLTIVLNKLPGFMGGGGFEQNEFLQRTAQMYRDAAEVAAKGFVELSNKALPSALLKKRFKEIEKEVQKTAETIAAQANVSTELVNENINSLPVELETSTAKMVATVQRDAPKAANVYVSAWDKAVERVDATFADAWTGAYDGFKSFGDNIVGSFKTMLAEMAHLAITKPIIIGLGMGGSGTASASSGFGQLLSGGGGGGGGFSITDIISNARSFFNLNGAINGAIDGVVNGLFNAGFQDAAIGVGNVSQGVTGASGGVGGAGGGIATTAVAGFAGSYAGTAVGEGLFGKQANSSIGATAGSTIGAVVGSYVPYIGTALGTAVGGFIGGLADAAFGGDGKKRAALGVRTRAGLAAGGQPQAQGASGLLYTGYTKRAGAGAGETAQQMIDQFVALDAVLTQGVRGLGGTVDLAGKSLTGKAHQAGKSGGDFFGAAAFNSLSGADVKGAADVFVFAWLDAVKNTLPARTRNILSAVDKDAASLVGTVQSLGNIFGAMKVSAGDLFTVADELANKTAVSLFDSYELQTNSTISLAQAYDGSLSSLQAYERAMLQQRDTTFLVAQQIKNTQASLADSFSEIKNSISDALLSPEQLYNTRRGRIGELTNDLKTELDPAAIQRLALDIGSLTKTTFNSIDSSQRAASGTDFVGFIEQIDILARQRLDASAAHVQEGVDVADAVFNTSADSMVSAAMTQQQAAANFNAGVESFISALNHWMINSSVGEINA